MQSIVPAPSTKIYRPIVQLRKEKQDLDRILFELEKPLYKFQFANQKNRLKKRNYDEMTLSSTNSVLRARILNILSSQHLLGYKILSTPDCAILLNVIPINEFKGLVEDIYDSCQEPKLVKCVQRALNYMRMNWKTFSAERIDFINEYPVVSFVPDVLDANLVQLIQGKIKDAVLSEYEPGFYWRVVNWIRPIPAPAETKRYNVFWKRFALSVEKNKNTLYFTFRDGKNPLYAPVMNGFEPAIEKSIKAFVKHLYFKLGVKVTQNIMGVQAFLMHGHVKPGDVYKAVDWHKDSTAFGVPDYIMVLMLSDRHSEYGWDGGEFWCFKGRNEFEADQHPLVKLNTQFNQGIILKNDEAFHFVSPVYASQSYPAGRDILILDLYLNWENVARGLLIREEDDNG